MILANRNKGAESERNPGSRARSITLHAAEGAKAQAAGWTPGGPCRASLLLLVHIQHTLCGRGSLPAGGPDSSSSGQAGPGFPCLDAGEGDQGRAVCTWWLCSPVPVCAWWPCSPVPCVPGGFAPQYPLLTSETFHLAKDKSPLGFCGFY